MFESVEILRLSQAMARHAGTRQAIAAGNMANADTPGYKARDLVSFPEVIRQDAAQFGQRATRDNHLNGMRAGAFPAPIEDETTVSDPNGNSVSLETEMMRAVEIRRQHDRALAIYRSSLNILRASIGRK